MLRYSQFPHPGSSNHGCEAIVRSTKKILNLPFVLFSYNKQKDILFNLNEVVEIEKTNEVKRITLRNFFYKLYSLIFGNKNLYYNYRYRKILVNRAKLAFSIGGDNYCYGIPYNLIYLNKKLNSKGIQTVLWGCSVEPDMLNNPLIVEDLKRYALITARESITYDALINAGISKNTKLYPDPAFQLDKKVLPLPENFKRSNTIGINVSPMIINCETTKGGTMNNYKSLVRHIIDNSSFNIALIPHVTGIQNDDREPLAELYKEFKSSKRVILLPECNCMEIKGHISNCRMFIGARTHATIAAYSSCVPTLVIGYSVKAKGIAKDIFGSYKNYVIPVQTLMNSNDLINAYNWLHENEEEIRKHLTSFIYGYCKTALNAGNEIKALLNSDSNC